MPRRRPYSILTLAHAARRPLAAVALLALVLLILADRYGLIPAPPAGPDHQRYHLQTFTVANVVDGDTLDLDIPDRLGDHPTTRVRLWGVDTPETHGRDTPAHFGPEAAELTRSLTLGQKVLVALEPTHPSRDRYDRLLAYIYLAPDVDLPPSLLAPTPPTKLPDPDILAHRPMLNELLLTAGCAYADERFPHLWFDRFLQLQTQAQSAHQGLWKSPSPKDHPQWYRKRHR